VSPERPNPWNGAVITKMSVVRSGNPIAFYSVRVPLLEATLIGCTLRRTKAGKLWCSPPKQRRQLPDGTTQYDDILEWDGGGPATRFSDACIEAIGRHSPDLLTPLIEGNSEPAPRGRIMPPRHDDAPVSVPDWWSDER
jgi:hypothetical protein